MSCQIDGTCDYGLGGAGAAANGTGAASTSTGTATQTEVVLQKCYPMDCYAQCKEMDKEKQKMCAAANKVHVAKMKELGCKGTACRTSRLGKSCKRVKQPAKCTKRRKRKPCGC